VQERGELLGVLVLVEADGLGRIVHVGCGSLVKGEPLGDGWG
jgi:hypothetical protein